MVHNDGHNFCWLQVELEIHNLAVFLAYSQIHPSMPNVHHKSYGGQRCALHLCLF